MAIYLSNLMQNGALVRQAADTGEHSVTAVILIPSGTALADNSQLKIARFADNLNVTQIVVRAPDLDSDGSPTLSVAIGYARPTVDPSLALSSANPAVTGAVAADSLAYYAATATAPYQAGGVSRFVLGQSGLDNEFANNPQNGVDGITDMCLVVTEPAAGAVAADAYVYVDVYYTGANQTPSSLTMNYEAPY